MSSPSPNRSQRWWCPFVAACCPALAACIPTPPTTLRDAHVEVPATFGDEAVEDDQVPGTTSSAELDWHEFFGDPHLVALMDLAVENSQELNIAIQDMIVANTEVMTRRGEIFPTLSAGVGAGVDRAGTYTSQGQSDEHLDVAPDLPSFSLGLYASWEIDVWGRLRDSADAAMYRYLASAEGRSFMITRLVAEIAARYYELLALDRQLAILTDNVRLQQDALQMVILQQQAARTTMLAVRRFEAQLRAFESRRYETMQQIVATENQLNFLVGRFPQHVERSSDDFLAITPPAVRAGPTTGLLENRPDVRQAELELAGARLDVSAARARFYPSLRLEVGGGYRSFDITQLFATPASIFYGFLAGITAPLLNRSGITADFFAASARQMQAVLRYERTILSAFVDVSTGLARVDNLTRTYEVRSEQVARLQESVDMSMMLFNAARADYLEVLTTRRDYLEAQMELVETKQRQLAAAVTLYQALGGGWRLRSQPSDPEPMGAVP